MKRLTEFQLGWYGSAAHNGRLLPPDVVDQMIGEIRYLRTGDTVHDVALSTTLDRGCRIVIGGPITPRAIEMLRAHADLLADIYAESAPNTATAPVEPSSAPEPA